MFTVRNDRRAWRSARLAFAALTIASLALTASLRADRLALRSEARLRADVSYLADDAREGRGPETAGLDQAAEYIAEAFKSAGLKTAPGADGYFQPFEITGRPQLGQPIRLAVEAPGDKTFEGKVGRDFNPLAIGIGGAVKGIPIVFAGYGITAQDRDGKLNYDDYADIDVKGKAVLIIRREPQQDDPESVFSGKETTVYASFRHKATNAYQHGAAAVLLVNDLAGLKGAKDNLLLFGEAGGDPNSRLPFVMVSRDFADTLLDAAGAPTLAALEKQIDSDLKPRSRVLEGLKLDEAVTIERRDLKVKNVVGVLEGSGPLAEETIVVGAHYDHLGRGDVGSLAFGSKDIHNGADDNASGTAMMMEMARRLASRPDPLPRRIVFMAFSGEERGLLGSRHYVDHPLIPLDKTVFMVNFDMVGRLNDKDELSVLGVGTSPGLSELVDTLGSAAGFNLKKTSGVSDGFGGSDHQSFHARGIPVLFEFTGVHPQYHRPSDDVERINFDGMARIANFSEQLLLNLAYRSTRPTLAAAKAAPQQRVGAVRASGGAYFGTRPDYREGDEGVRLDGVTEGSPAEKAGLKGGDVIVGMDGKKIGTINDYMDMISRHKPGDVVDLKVLRDGKEVILKVTAGSRSPGS